MDILEVEIDKNSIVKGKIDGAQCAAQVTLSALVEDSQIEIDSFAQVFVNTRKVGLSPNGAEGQDFHRLLHCHSLAALRV
ncbi:hypothetical protein D3C77_608900 [compost metagenome]